MCACLNFVKIPNAPSVFLFFLSVPVKPSAYVSVCPGSEEVRCLCMLFSAHVNINF